MQKPLLPASLPTSGIFTLTDVSNYINYGQYSNTISSCQTVGT